MIKGYVENALCHFDLHFSEQYLTFSQSRCHFLRHSNSSPQEAQVFGAKPFLVLAMRGMVNLSICHESTPERTRTSNRQGRNLVLYPLSYGRIASGYPRALQFYLRETTSVFRTLD